MPASVPTIRMRAFTGLLTAFHVDPSGYGHQRGFGVVATVTTVTSVPGLSLTPYKTYPLLTYTNLLVTVATVVTMPVPQRFLVSPVIDGHQFQRGDVLGLACLRHLFAVFVDPFVTGPDLNP